MENEVVLPTQLAEYPHAALMTERGLTIKIVPPELAKQITNLNLGIRTSKAQDKIEANIKKSVVIADAIQNFLEVGRQDPPSGPSEAEIAAKAQADAQAAAEAQAAADEQAKADLEAAEAQVAAKQKRSFGNDIFDTIFGVH